MSAPRKTVAENRPGVVVLDITKGQEEKVGAGRLRRAGDGRYGEAGRLDVLSGASC